VQRSRNLIGDNRHEAHRYTTKHVPSLSRNSDRTPAATPGYAQSSLIPVRGIVRWPSPARRHTAKRFRVMIANRLTGHRGYRVIQQISGVGPAFAVIFIAEIGDIGRFPRPEKLTCWAGLTPRHRESDTTVCRGPITKMGCGGRGGALRVRGA
jgi:hypothetical protein